jgi:ribosomal-protein-alanine N-acetyltransferase
VSIRCTPLPPGAAAPLSQLHRRCFPDDPWDGAACGEVLAMPGCFGILAWQGKAPIGFALALDLRGECEVISLGVVPERRRRGVGTALIAALIAAARGRGARSLVLEVAEDNIAAAALYAACGFVAIGRRPDYYRRFRQFVDALVLRLRLDLPAGSI